MCRREEAPPLRKRNPPPLHTSRQVYALVTELSGVSAREHAQIGVEARMGNALLVVEGVEWKAKEDVVADRGVDDEGLLRHVGHLASDAGSRAIHLQEGRQMEGLRERTNTRGGTTAYHNQNARLWIRIRFGYGSFPQSSH